MTVIDVESEIQDFLPTSLTVANGDIFTVDWVPALEDAQHKAPPYGTYQFIASDVVDPFPIHAGFKKSTENQVDTITFSDGTSVYKVTERDIDSVNSLTDASNDTFVEGTDFEIHSTDDSERNDAIKFLDGGSTPDDGEDFDVDYEHRLYAEQHNRRGFFTYRLVLKVKELDSSHSEASKFYFKSFLGNELIEALTEFFDKNDGATLTSTGELWFEDYANFGRVSVTDDEALARYLIDIRLGRTKTIDDDTTFRVSGEHSLTAEEI